MEDFRGIVLKIQFGVPSWKLHLWTCIVMSLRSCLIFLPHLLWSPNRLSHCIWPWRTAIAPLWPTLSLGVLFQKRGFHCVTSPSRPPIFVLLFRSSPNLPDPIVKACTFDHFASPLLLFSSSIHVTVSWPLISVPHPFMSFLHCRG